MRSIERPIDAPAHRKTPLSGLERQTVGGAAPKNFFTLERDRIASKQLLVDVDGILILFPGFDAPANAAHAFTKLRLTLSCLRPFVIIQ